MIVVAIDTCEARGSVALLDGAEVVHVSVHNVGEEYSSWLLPAVDLALQAAKASFADVNLYAVASGPGSFTGVRIGLTTIKAWSEVFGKPIVALSRLEVVAAQSEGESPYVASFIDAQRGQIFGALYQRGEKELTLVEQEMVASPEMFIEQVQTRAGGKEVAWISTDPDSISQQPGWQKTAAHGEMIQSMPCILAPRLGKIALLRAAKGEVQDALTVDANYVRRSYVEVFQKDPAHVPGK